jgi:hypothetical protein
MAAALSSQALGELAQAVRTRGISPSHHLDFLLSVLYDRHPLEPGHIADLRKSGLSDETIARQKFRSVPLSMLIPGKEYPAPLGLRLPAEAHSAMLVPFPDPRVSGGWMNHVRLKIFPALTDADGHTVKYLQPRGSPPRLFFPLVALDAVLRGTAPLLR